MLPTHRCKRLVSTLDSIKKLVTHDGVIVTKGYVSGEMSFDETVDYLSKLGIYGLYESVITKSVRVPPGFRAQHLVSNKVYERGAFIPVREKTWDEFVAAAQGDRSSNWNIEETGEVGAEDAPREVAHVDYQEAVTRMSNRYDEQDLGTVSDYLMARANEIDDEELKAEQISKVEEFILDIHSQVNAASEVPLSDKIRIKDIIDEFKADVDIAYQSTRNTLSLTLGKGNIHFGAFVAAMDISGNQNVLQKLQKLMTNVSAGKIVGQAEIDVTDIFPKGLSTDEEKSAYKDMLLSLQDGADEDRLILGASSVGQSLKSLLAKSTTTPRDIAINSAFLAEEALQAKEYLQSLNSPDSSHQKVLEAVESLDFAKKVTEFQRSLTSGNLLVQTMLDYSHSVFGRLNVELINTLDEAFDFESALGDTLQNILHEPLAKGGIASDGVRREIKDRLYGKTLASKIKTPKLEVFSNNIRKVFSSTLQSGEIIAVVDNPKLSDSQIDEIFNGDEINKFATSYGLSNPDEFRRIVAEDMLVKQRAMGNKLNIAPAAHLEWDTLVNGIIGRYNVVADKPLTSSNMPKLVRAAITPAMNTLVRRRLKGSISFLDKQGNTKSALQNAVPTTKEQNVAIRKDSVEGLVALAAFSVHSTWRDSPSIDRDAVQRAATAAVYFAGSSDIKVNPDTGGIVNISPDGSTFLHMRILSLARFLPPISKNGYEWANDVKEHMALEILLSKGKAKEDITDLDRLEFFASSDEDIRPIHATGENIRAGLKNVTVGKTNDPNQTKSEQYEKVLSREEANKLASIVDYDTSAASNRRRNGDISTVMKGFIGDKHVGGVALHHNLVLGEVGDNTFEGWSLSSIASHIKDYDEDIDSRNALIGSMAQIAYNRAIKNIPEGSVPEHIRGEVADYIKNRVTIGGKALEKGKSNFGLHFEELSYIPILIANLKDAVSFEVLTPKIHENGAPSQHQSDAFAGVRWKDKKGNTNLLGKFNGSTGGTMDVTHVMHNVDGNVRISGYETKMERGEPAVMHHGNADHACRFLAKYYKDNSERINKITYNDTTMLSASYGEEAERYTYAGGVRWKRSGKTYVEAGNNLDVGTVTKDGYE